MNQRPHYLCHRTLTGINGADERHSAQRTVSPTLDGMVQDILAESHHFDMESSSREQSQTATTSSTILMSHLLMLGGLVLVMVGGFFATRSWIVTPVISPQQRKQR
jgi:hypothetical protein